MTEVICGGAVMDFDDYEEIFQLAASEDVRTADERISEQEWMLLATVTQEQVVRRIREDLRKKALFFYRSLQMFGIINDVVVNFPNDLEKWGGHEDSKRFGKFLFSAHQSKRLELSPRLDLYHRVK
jgi:hypothetical protein